MAAFLERMRHWHWSSLSLCVFTWCLALSLMPGPGLFAAGEEDVIDINDFLNKLESKPQRMAGQEERKVRKQWGLADTTASLGKLFRYHIPADAFQGEIDHYEVKEATSDGLPKWVYFNNSTTTLEGVPTSKDVGLFYVTIIAIGPPLLSGESNSAQDVFSIDVLPTSHDNRKMLLLKDADSASAPLRCDSNEEVTTLSITLDGNLNAMDAASRVQLANRMLKRMKLSEEQLRLVPMEYREGSFDGNTIMAGPGNAREKHSPGLRLQWQVGCGHRGIETYEPLVDSLEKSSRDGTLAEELQLPVIGWHLANFKPGASRQKRQPYYGNPTPVPVPMPTRFPTATKTVTDYPVWEPEETDHQTGDDEGPVPDSRIIPTMASPTFTFATPSSHHHHRHHHGEGPQRHHQEHHEEQMLTASPTFHHFRGTPVLSTPVPTPALPPIHPTRPVYPMETTDTAAQPTVVTHVETSVPYHTSEIAPTRVEPPVIASTATATAHPPHQNFRPVIQNRLQWVVFIAGKVSRFLVPEDTFADFEDGNTRALKLLLTNMDGTALPSTSWIQFNADRQEIYAVPLEVNIGKWDLVLEAMDSEGNSTKLSIEVIVRQHPSSRVVHHEFSMHMKYDRWRFASNVDWQLKLAEKLAAFFGDADERSIVVRSVSTDPTVVFTWTNESLPQHPCPQEKIYELLAQMAYKGQGEHEGASSKHLRKAMLPEFRVSKVSVSLLGHCKQKPPPTSTTFTNVKPRLANHIDSINATQGRLLHFVVPEDTFFDEEDGMVRNLKLRFLTIDGVDVPRTSWIQFNNVTQEFIGLPMAEDVGLVQYQLVAIDRYGLSVSDALIITVEKPPGGRLPSVEFSLHISADFAAFNAEVKNKIMMLDKLAHLYGDPDPRHITVQSITRGSVVFTWSNDTLPAEPTCPTLLINQLVKVMFNDNGTVSEHMLNTFLPEFNITAAVVIPRGMCLADITPTKIHIRPSSTAETDQAYADDDIYITTIIPAVVIAAMLIVAAIIACVLYRKKRKGKMTMEDNGTFVNKGIPIIFADELEDKPDPAKSPVIMKEEKPPLPPPEYPRSSGSASPSTPQTEQRKREHELRDADDFGLEQAENSPPYQPPPPFTSNRDSRLNRPKHTPTYRLPPPYVPP